MFVEKEQCRESLVLGLGRHPLVLRQKSQKRFGLLLRREPGRQSPAEIIIAGNPTAVGLLRAVGEVEQPDLFPNQGHNSGF